MASYDYDVMVIGSGAGGSVTAQQIVKSGKSVAIVEAGKLGGEVLNYSSIPTKALLQSASIYEAAKRGSTFGIRGSTVGYNYPTVKAWKDAVCRKTSLEYSQEYYTDQGISVIAGRAFFIDPHTITVGTARFTARSFVIATGSDLVAPEITGLFTSGYLTYREVINLNRPPKSVAIIGGGTAGCEFAQLLAIFGSKVTLIEASSRLIGEEEPEISTLLEKRFTKEYGITVLLNTSVETVTKLGLKRKLALKKGTKAAQIGVDELIVTTGKLAAVDIGLENAGVRYKEGQIYTDRFQKTSAKHIFAVGDCAGPYNYTHTAAYQGQIVAHNIVHPKSPVVAKYSAIPRTIFTTPQVAATGLTEAQLKDRGRSYRAVTVPIRIIAKSATTNFTDGFVKILASKNTGALLGATVVCPEASEVIHELTLAVQYNLTAQQVAHTVHAFGTWSEAVRVACAKLSKA